MSAAGLPRARAVSATPGAQAENQTVLQSLQYRLARLGERLPLLDATQRTKLALLLRQAGWRNQLALPVFASIKFVSCCFLFDTKAIKKNK